MERKAPEVVCDGCGEVVDADQCEPVCGWLICHACRTEAGIVGQQSSGYDYAIDLPPFWGSFGEHKGYN